MIKLLALMALTQTAHAAVPDTATFAFDLYRETSGAQGNVFFSPYSISTALAMTSAGAKGKTWEEMMSVLQPGTNTDYKLLRTTLQTEDPDRPTLTTANRLWGKTGNTYEPAFLALTKNDFGASLESLDFAGDPKGSAKTINQWVEKETHDKIRDLVSPLMIDKKTNLILTNAIYFKGKWDKPFPAGQTRPMTFHEDGGKTEQHDFMRLKEHVEYWENDDFQIIRLPYHGKEIAMTVVLPKKGKTLKSLAKKLNPDLLRDMRNGMAERQVDISLPKFRVEYETQLRQPLERLGMKQAFTTQADFSGIRKPVADDPLYISAVVHKAFVEVDETGTEAAAATAVFMAVGAAYHAPMEPKVFTADHPFLFLIEQVPTNTVLFLGRMSRP
ncbi:MAG: serpin family protein [Bdellovibrionota bacterium]